MSASQFREAGYMLVDRIAAFIKDLPSKKVNTAESPAAIRKRLSHISYDTAGEDAKHILMEASNLLIEHSLFNGHPRFWGYITSSAAPIGALADLLASSINANVGAFDLSPMATEIERQTIQWLSDFIGYAPDCDGLFVSGGNVANFIGVLAARRKFSPAVRAKGILPQSAPAGPWGVYSDKVQPVAGEAKLLIYCARGTHTWVQKAADLFGHGTEAIRWVACDRSMRMDTDDLRRQIGADKRKGHLPFVVIGNAGTVSTGSVDHLEEISAISKEHGVWFHIDGAYGAPAAGLEEWAPAFRGLPLADSIAIDPHKWLYAPIEAGCILVKNKGDLENTFRYTPEYYNFDGKSEEKPLNYHELGLQNSRGFKALKVWASMRQVGKAGFRELIRRDILLAQRLYTLADEHECLEAVTQNLSITTFRFVPKNFSNGDPDYLNSLNKTLLNTLQSNGEVYLSNAVVDGRYCLRVCIVNFRTEFPDLEALVRLAVEQGNILHETAFVSTNA